MQPEDLLFTVLDGRYALQAFLGEGGFAWVYQATDVTNKGSVAIKVLKPGALTHQQAELENEGSLLDRLKPARNVVDLLGAPINHATLPATLPSGASTAIPLHFLVLELMDGNLADLLGLRHEISWTERLSILRGVVCGANQMHVQSIFHRDIKSENILLRSAPKNTFETKVADLGRSKDEHDATSLTSYEIGRGDFRFAPPEFLWGLGSSSSVCFRSADVYLIGATFFELATGQTLTSLVFPNPILWIQRAMAMNPADRESDFRARFGEIRSRYELPLTMFEHELSHSIRHEAVDLVRQLCDPDPQVRLQRTRSELRLTLSGLDWLIRRVDILTKRLSVESRRSTRYVKAGRARI